MGVGRDRWMERAAAGAWITVLICLLAQVATEAAMRTPYSFLRDAISDLGVTTCTPQICSPWYWMVDGSFVVLGLCLVLGGWLSHVSAPRLWWGSWAATVGLSVGGLGMAVVGLVPENVHFAVHVAGALAGLIGANVGTLFAGWALLRVRGHRVTGGSAIVVGVVGVAGSALSILVFGRYLPALLNVGGGLERLGVEPLLLITAISGGTLLLGEDVLAVALRQVRRSRLPGSDDQREIAPGPPQRAELDVEPLAVELVDHLGEQEGQVVHHEGRPY